MTNKTTASQPKPPSGNRCPCDSSGTCQDVCPDPATGLPLCASADCYSTGAASQPKSIEEDAQGEIRKVHHLKTDPAVFFAVARGAKTHEIRLNDRDFQVGDRLVLAETESTGAAMRSAPKLYPLVYTGRTESRIVSHIQTGYGLADGWCILSFRAPAAQASATIQAAPSDEQILKIAAEQDYGDEDPKCIIRLARALFAATIQEPVMVAEPVGKQDQFDRDIKLAEAVRSHIANYCGGKLGIEAARIVNMVELAKIVDLAAPMVADPAGVASPTLGEVFASVGGWMNGGELGYPSFGSMEALRVFTQRSIRAALAATVKAVPSEALELTELADAMQYWGGVFADGFAEAGDAVRSRGYSDERWVNARSALEWMRNRLYKHGKMGHPDAHAKYGSPSPGAAPLADKTTNTGEKA